MKKQKSGFTLIELLVAMAIVGILVSVAYPAYTRHVQKGKRADAKAELVEAQNAMERYYTLNNTYLDAAAGVEFPSQIPNLGTANYTLALSGVTANTYTITATPQGSQASDWCGALSINQANVRIPLTGCW